MIDQEKKTIHRRILLLGGTGAMGEHLTRILAEQGDDVYVTTRSCRLSERNITYVQGMRMKLRLLTICFENLGMQLLILWCTIRMNFVFVFLSY